MTYLYKLHIFFKFIGICDNLSPYNFYSDLIYVQVDMSLPKLCCYMRCEVGPGGITCHILWTVIMSEMGFDVITMPLKTPK